MKTRLFLLAFIFVALSTTQVPAQFIVSGLSKQISLCTPSSDTLKLQQILPASFGDTATIKLIFRNKFAYVEILDSRIVNRQGEIGVLRLQLTNPNKVNICITFKINILEGRPNTAVSPDDSASVSFMGYGPPK